MDLAFETEAARLREEAEREEASPAYLAKRAAKRAAEAERNARAAGQYEAWKAEMKANGEWVEDEPEED